MRVNIITCHNVYNAGASLQTYSLQSYLQSCGYDVAIVDYLPDYLQHYSLWGISNSSYDKFFIRYLYQIAKFPKRLFDRFSGKKRKFDDFTRKYLLLTPKHYSTFTDLKNDPPIADVYICGSDQIWNPLFKNGKDPAFFLEFAPKEKVRASYAASIATNHFPDDMVLELKHRIEGLDFISVRESSSITLLENVMGIQNAISVLDPVFLHDASFWEKISYTIDMPKYVLIYDFDGNSTVKECAKKVAKERNLKIVSIQKLGYEDYSRCDTDPIDFVSLVHNAEFVISNSFHATAFSILFEKDFVVIRRNQNINTRMEDLLQLFGLSDRLIASEDLQKSTRTVDWKNVRAILQTEKTKSKEYLSMVLSQK